MKVNGGRDEKNARLLEPEQIINAFHILTLCPGQTGSCISGAKSTASPRDVIGAYSDLQITLQKDAVFLTQVCNYNPLLLLCASAVTQSDGMSVEEVDEFTKKGAMLGQNMYLKNEIALLFGSKGHICNGMCTRRRVEKLQYIPSTFTSRVSIFKSVALLGRESKTLTHESRFKSPSVSGEIRTLINASGTTEPSRRWPDRKVVLSGPRQHRLFSFRGRGKVQSVEGSFP
jgi:hypothetical protein